MPKLRAYVVEDSAVFREALADVLAECDATMVGFAEDERSAATWLESNACDLVIVDIWLRGGSGLGLLARINSAPRRFKWIVLSSYVNETLRRAAFTFGAEEAFDKASDLEALVAYCRGLADRARSGRDAPIEEHRQVTPPIPLTSRTLPVT